ncbi:39S ribosomal protein L16, mitochondrial-like [Mercenaria mercenaria]|uniref:39S ribosomal protein L16, mitochondrial-like n=1 Tax=Mercenaria mercenaria TaxID=6596 RepID=UPI00234E649B|nr:39S ribosomal protein L16, mitochondrial-like [Mercenaria mercenaria]
MDINVLFIKAKVQSPVYVQAAGIMKLKKPPNYDHVQYPERMRLRMMEKIPEPLSATRAHYKMSKRLELMRGPEQTHNRIIYGEYGIQALAGGRLKPQHIDNIRLQVIRKMDDKKSFAYWRFDPPWQSVTKKGQGVRMGGGKGAIKFYVTPIRARRIILEMGGEVEFEEVKPILQVVIDMLPFEARIVSRESLEQLNKEEELLEKMNQNPFTFEYAAKNNMLGIKKWLSPYDYLWYGKYR